MKKNAFTLVELIATIGLLGMLATITITISVRKINETKEKARDTMIESIELAAKNYINDYGNEILEFNNNDNVYISLQTLVEKEYFTESLIDPTTKKSLPLTNEIYVTREESGEITSTYNVNQRKEPKITLIGSYNEYVEEGSEYVEKGVIAINSSKEDVSTIITITGNVDTTTPNTYKITYELDNVKITRNVIVYNKNIASKELYKFTIDLDGGNNGIQYENKYETGSTILLAEPVKEDYIFKGWKVIGKGIKLNDNILIMGKSEIKVKANWEKKIKTINFNSDNFNTIVGAVKQAFENNMLYPYNVDETKIINLGTFGSHTIRVANTTKCSELETRIYSETACGFVIEFVDIITNYNINPAGEYNGIQYDNGHNFGGWPATKIRKYINETIYKEIPEDLRKGIIDTYVLSSHGKSDKTGNLENYNFESIDKLYLLSPQEVYGTSFTNKYDSTNGTSRQLDYYKIKNVTITNKDQAIKKKETIPSDWWLRSAGSYTDYNFYKIDSLGEWSGEAVYYEYGISPAFRLAE